MASDPKNQAAATPPKPAPNPGTKGTPTNQPCAECQKAALAECDVDTLEITATPSPSGDPRSIKAEKRMRRWVTPEERKTYPAHILQYLEEFDVVLDCTAGFKDGYLKTAKTASQPNMQTLSAKATFHAAGKCPDRDHPKISAKVLVGTPQCIQWKHSEAKPPKKDANGKDLPTPPAEERSTTGTIGPWAGDDYRKYETEVPWPIEGARRFYAEPIFSNDSKESNDFMFIFYFIHALMFQKPKLVQVVADAHGKRNDGKPVRQSLRGLYRIFREDQISFVFAYKGPGRQMLEEPPPPEADTKRASVLAQYAKEAEALAEKKRPKPTNAATQATTEPSGKKGFVSYIYGTKLTEPGISIQVSLNDETLNIVNKERIEQIKQLKEAWSKLQLPSFKSLLPPVPAKKPSGSENGDSAMVSLGSWLSLLWQISVQSLQKKLTDFFRLLKDSAKVGYWLELDFSWFEGNIGFRYATKAGKNYERYKSIVHGWSLVKEITIIGLQLTFKAGAQASFAGVSLWAYLYAAVAFKVTTAVEISLDSENAGDSKFEISSEPELAVGVSGGATVLGMGLTVNAEARCRFIIKSTDEYVGIPCQHKTEVIVAFIPPVLDFRAKSHVPGCAKLSPGFNGQWHPWGVARHIFWTAKSPP